MAGVPERDVMQFLPTLRRPGRRAGAALAAVLASAGMAGAAASHADAAPYYETLRAQHSGLNLDVQGASKQPYAPVIQWYANGGDNQKWRIPGDRQTGPIVNKNSQMCLTTDGISNHQLFQYPCYGGPLQRFSIATASTSPGGLLKVVTIQNPATGLAVDVSGHSQWAGAGVNLWYPNANDNQTFYTGQY
jgi:hypothetical protein